MLNTYADYVNQGHLCCCGGGTPQFYVNTVTDDAPPPTTGGGTDPDATPLDAVIDGADTDNKSIDTTGSTGDYIRLVIKDKNGNIQEVTSFEPNTGTNVIPYTSNPDNLWTICVQTSNDTTFTTIDEECITIPDPNIGFVVP